MELGFLPPGVIFVTCALAACWAQSIASSWVNHALRAALGPRPFALLIGGPSIVLHEMTHLLVSVLSGHFVAGVHLGRAFRTHGAMAHVDIRYNPESLRHRFGLSLSALSPALLPLLLLSGAITYFDLNPCTQHLHRWLLQLYNTADSVLSLALAPVLIILIASMPLSRQDWKTAVGAILAFLAVALGVEWVIPHRGAPWAWPPVQALQGATMLTLSASLALLVTSMPIVVMRWTLAQFATPHALHPPKSGRH